MFLDGFVTLRLGKLPSAWRLGPSHEGSSSASREPCATWLVYRKLSEVLVLSHPIAHPLHTISSHTTVTLDNMSLPGEVSDDKNAKPMRAARFYGKEHIEIKDDIPRPTCGDGQVKIEPAFVGICGTDLHEYLGGPT